MKKLLTSVAISLPTILFCVCLTNAGQRGLGTPAANGLVIQQITLKGKVLSAVNDEPLAGATVRTEITSIKTDQKGNFTVITNKNKGTLTVTYLGYQSKEIPFDISSNREYIIKLDPQQNTLDETVVIAYGQTTKRFNTGSVGRVTAAEISRQPVANPIAALQGRIPGVEITQQSGRTGANFNVLIRGRSSIDNGNEPLYIVDGVPWLSNSLSRLAGAAGPQSPFNSLNPQDIQSMEVLKDADATAIYGSRGANGVILITTKKGSTGKTRIDLNAYTGISKVPHIMPLMNTEQYLSMRREALSNDGITPTNTNAPDLLLYDQQRYTDWTKILIGNTAKLADIQTALSGGNTSTQFRLAGGYRRETNVYPGDNANKRASGQLNLTHRSDNERLLASLTVNYSNDNNNLPPFDLTSGIYTAPNLKAYEADGSLAWNENGSAIRNNPLSSTFQSFNTLTNNFLSNLNLEYKLTERISARVNAGYTNIETRESVIRPLVSYLPSASRRSGDSQFSDTRFRSWILEPQLHYSKQLPNHKLDVLLGASWQEELLRGTTISASNYSSENLLHTTSGAATLSTTENYGLYRYQSVFGRVTYQYLGRYLLNLTGRRDGSSRFGPNRQFANFGAVGAAWIFSEELFVKNRLNWLSYGKIRGSFGLTGNDKIGNYQFLDTYGNIGYPYDGIAGLAPQRLFNADYEWESNRKLELALELGFFKDRILISGGWFRNRSGNQLLQYTLPTQTGFSGITRNLPALVENKGWELDINTVNIQHDGFKWATSFNLTIAGNKLLEFPDLEISSYANQYAIGKSINIAKVYPYRGVNPETGVWMVDLTAGRNVIKELTPKFYGGFNNSLSYKRIQLDIFFQFVKKDAHNYLYSLPALPGLLNNNLPVILEERWQQEGDLTDIQRFGTTGITSTARTNYLLSEGVFTDASFIRLKNVSLAYRLPDSWNAKIGTHIIRLYCQAQNLLTITGYKGNDPEVTDMTTLPPLRTITFGAHVTF